jgi:hypothetical protein
MKHVKFHVWGVSDGNDNTSNNHGDVQLTYFGDTKEFVSAVIEVLTGKLNRGELHMEEGL